MDCNQAEELMAPYVLGALDSEERAKMDSHVNTCIPCSLKLEGDGEVVARLASTVPQLEVPISVKTRLFSRIDADIASEASRSRVATPVTGSVWAGIWSVINQKFVPHASTAMASVLVGALVFSGIWFNNRLSDLSSDNDALNTQLESIVERETDMMNIVTEQRKITIDALSMTAASETSVNLLKATGPSPVTAHGVMMVSHTESRALLLVLNLPPLPPGMAYQVWLISGDRRYSAGMFKVDSTGYGQAIVIPTVPFAEIDAIGITVEPEGGSLGPTGANVLSGDL
ncbi:MAG: anti-sigma factor [Chloroflexi bacterium]|nr:anti-sigma factor [Chloroflexota bacterium]